METCYLLLLCLFFKNNDDESDQYTVIFNRYANIYDKDASGKQASDNSNNNNVK